MMLEVGLACAFYLAVGSPASRPELAPTLPTPVSEGAWRPLEESVDPQLQRALRRAVEARPSWRGLARRKRMAVGLVDLADIRRPRYAAVNGNVEMYAASLPKIAILLAVYQAMEDGLVAETEEVHADLGAMIRVSCNEAATRMIDAVGFPYIEQVVTDPRYRLYDPRRGGGLWVGKRYAKAGPRIGDPLQNISHAANVLQVCRFYYLLATGRVVSPERSRQMLEDLADPGLHHKFVGVLEQRAPRARLFRKSGTWRQWHADSVLVWGPDWRRYVLVAMVESDGGERILRDLVPVVEGVLEPKQARRTPTPTLAPGPAAD